ncbi:ABC transporter permease subunit [Leptospirillum ferrooxidans]|uniref:Putative binding-protein-dependent transport systems inner membrane component n=1 Tax=Leptospirillum ferrooxidans (strain C2-3) TaxID=1162668 RepID=I0IL82_LEPFC|nr:ABC transporter permease subunit [Leptospirillum ferrooxidans]BAM06031.1 putative binding-protein-dependent transport systems inner membrane component [Leptospirillum ferrooxidans C2-3]
MSPRIRSNAVMAGALIVLTLLSWILFRHHILLQGGQIEKAEISALPKDLALSVLRLLGGYLISLVFAYCYGLLTALTPWGERYLLPVLDILQSIPILGFFPAVVFVLAHLFSNPLHGVELASMVLIATSMAWNMAFAVFESIRTAPHEFSELMRQIQAPWWIRLSRYLIPVTIPKMVYNSILSWAQGWYFLIACEMISLGSVHYQLQGLGSFLVSATASGSMGLAILGILTLIVSVVLFDFFLFRPVMVWAERFRIEQNSSSFDRVESPFRDFLMDATILEQPRKFLGKMRSFFSDAMDRRFFQLESYGRKMEGKSPGGMRIFSRALPALSVIFVGFLGALAVRSLFRELSRGIPWSGLSELPLDLLFSIFRLLAGYFLSLLWTVPLAYMVFRFPRLHRTVMPVAQIMASVPATALFPFIIVLVVRTTNSMNLASIILLLSGMQWYLLFNLLAGVGSFPAEMREVSQTLGLSGMIFIRKVFLPFLYPSLLTGSITAFGGGWNALIVAEYVVYDNKDYGVRGIGAFLDRATYHSGNEILVVASLLLMTGVVVMLNRLFWTPLYERVTNKYGYHG